MSSEELFVVVASLHPSFLCSPSIKTTPTAATAATTTLPTLSYQPFSTMKAYTGYTVLIFGAMLHA
jgi:hypothetical protein